MVREATSEVTSPIESLPRSDFERPFSVMETLPPSIVTPGWKPAIEGRLPVFSSMISAVYTAAIAFVESTSELAASG